MISIAAIFLLIETASAKPVRLVPRSHLAVPVQPSTQSRGMGLAVAPTNGTSGVTPALSYPGLSPYVNSAIVRTPVLTTLPPMAPPPYSPTVAAPSASPSPLPSLMMPLLGLLNGAAGKSNAGSAANSSGSNSGFSAGNNSGDGGGSGSGGGALHSSGYLLRDTTGGPDGDGLCICSGKRKKLIQCARGYCEMLTEILNDQGSCAHKYMELIERTRPADIGQFCSNWTTRPDKQSAIMEILAELIHRESSWDPRNTGDHGTSKGFYQFTAETDRGYEDCHTLNNSNIWQPQENLRCGSCVALTNLYNKGRPSIARGKVGLGAYFGTMRTGIHDQIASRTNGYCVATGNSSGNMQTASRTPADATK